MDELALTFFPFPHVLRGKPRDGALYSWPERCLACPDRLCEKSNELGLRLCSRGVNYQRVDAELLIAGIVVRDYPGVPTKARQSVLRTVGKKVTTREALEKVLARGLASTDALAREFHEEREKIIANYRDSGAYKTDVVELLRPDLQQALAQVHDYKQFVQQIVQNIDVILETRFPGEPIDAKLAKAEHEEAAIYWAARLMDEKLDAALYLQYPERIHESRDRSRFRFHGLATKYRKIYQRQIDAKGLRVRLEGESYSRLEGNSRAIGIIPHAFIDNAVKYAPEGTVIVFGFEEAQDELTFSIESFGPRIADDEVDKVFNLFFRAADAKRRVSEGTGFGLGSAHNIANALGLTLTVRQDPTRTGPDSTYWTRFTVTLPTVGDKTSEHEVVRRPHSD